MIHRANLLLVRLGKSLGRRARGFRRVMRATASRARFAVGVKPLSYRWGFDRGHPVHRYYVDCFLQKHGRDIRGHCMEFQDASYVPRFGGTAVTKLDILHLDASNPRATLVADLTKPNDIPSGMFDCIVCTHVLHIVFDLKTIAFELHRLLKPGGVLLVAVPSVGMYEPRDHDLWRFTPEVLRLLLSDAFGGGHVTTHAYGNSLTSAGHIRGLVVADFTHDELMHQDEHFPVEVCGRAVKALSLWKA